MSVNLPKLHYLLNYLKDNDRQVQLMAVTKKRQVNDIIELTKQGINIFGENKVQEALLKYTSFSSELSFELHLIGPLQTNKVKQALGLFDIIQSLDRKKLLDEILKHLNENSKTQKFYIQVNIGRENQKSGIDPQELNDFYVLCKQCHIQIEGLMCIPPLHHEPDTYFREMINLRDSLNKELLLSMGMSGDYKTAVQYGSNMIRIGSLLFDEV